MMSIMSINDYTIEIEKIVNGKIQKVNQTLGEIMKLASSGAEYIFGKRSDDFHYPKLHRNPNPKHETPITEWAHEINKGKYINRIYLPNATHMPNIYQYPYQIAHEIIHSLNPGIKDSLNYKANCFEEGIATWFSFTFLDHYKYKYNKIGIENNLKEEYQKPYQITKKLFQNKPKSKNTIKKIRNQNNGKKFNQFTQDEMNQICSGAITNCEIRFLYIPFEEHRNSFK